MSRQEKGSRMRMLPPRVQLQQRDALTGSYPTNVRFSTDGRTGNYKVNFDDTSVVDFVTTTQSSSYSAPQNLGLEYSPLALYTFDGNINDQSGNSNNLSLHSGSLQYTDGPFYGSQAILFDGYNSLTSSVISALQITGAVTLQAFIKSNTTTVSSVGKAVASLAGIGESLKTNILYSMFVDGDNKAGSFGYDIEKGLGVDVSEFSVASLLQPGKWYHIAIARNGSSKNKLYLNGTLITSFTSLNFPEKDVSGNLQRLIVGTHPSSGGDYQAFAYKGAVSNLKIVNRELTADEIKSEFERIFPEGILAGVGFPIASKWIQNRIGLDLPTSGGISSPGNVTSQVVENLPFFHFTPGQELTPFRDNVQPAVDGKSQNNPFFATGSSVLEIGEGFSSPLWSKNKIEIDISIITPTTLSLVKDDNLVLNGNKSYPMAYYNFENKCWDRIGIGYGIGGASVGEALDKQMLGFFEGFSPSGAGNTYISSMGFASGDFGFPYHPKFHATSSQVLDLTQYITEPFMLEKAVIEFSGSWSVGSVNTLAYSIGTNQTVTSSVNTCFILNQRRNQNFTYNKSIPNVGSTPGSTVINVSVPTNKQLSYLGPTTYVDTIRDIVGFSQIYSFSTGSFEKNITAIDFNSYVNLEIPVTVNDIILTSSISGISGADWSGQYSLSMSMCTPAYGKNPFTNIISRFNTGPTTYDAFALGYDGYRTGVGFKNISTRGLVNDLYNTNIKRTATGLGITYDVPNKKHKINPYLLLPSDRLILGWQIPVSANPAQLIVANNYSESDFVFSPGVFKLTLYGSYVRANREYNDGTNQLLSSDNIHEVIE